MNKLKYSSVITKLITHFTIVSVLMFLASYVLFLVVQNNIEKKVIVDTSKDLQFLTQRRFINKFDVGITNAIAIANDVRLYSSLKTNDRELAINSLKDVTKKYKDSTPFKNIKVHVHTKDNHSFIRSWSIDEYGDDLSAFRKSVVQVNKTQEAISTFEVGKDGLSIRSIVPIKDNNEHLGSLEFMQGTDSITKLFEENQDYFLLLLDDKYQNLLSMANGSEKTQKYILSQKYYKKEFFEDTKKINFQELFEKGYYKNKNYFYTYVKVNDFENNELGIALIGKDIKNFNIAMEKSQEMINMTLLLITVLLILMYITTRVMINKEVNIPLRMAIDELTNGSAMMRNSSQRLQYSSSNLSQVALEQERSIEEMISNIKASYEKIEETNQNTIQAENISKEALASAQSGFVKMNELIESIQRIELSSNEISKIVTTIDTIAFQTNLLALNAAVEAARAGEYGMGFAVVASEVRNLATRSADEAKVITQKVNSTVEEIKMGNIIANESNMAFNNIVEQIKKTSLIINDISQSSENQRSGNQLLNTAMQDVENITHNIAINAEETEEDAKEMNLQAIETQKVVDVLANMVGSK